MVAFSDVAAKGQMILDGDFMRLNTMATKEEKQFLYSLMAMGGSALTIADQYDTIGDAVEIYQNREMIELNDLGFVGHPLSTDISNSDSSTWYGMLPDGNYIVGFFNREETIVACSINLEKELGIPSGCAKEVRDLWSHKNQGNAIQTISVTLKPHSCVIYRITPSESRIERSGFGCTRR